jgi:DNA-binding transcriptional MerR regulator
MASNGHPVAGEEILLKIGEVAAQTGTSLRMLHYYEELGLVAPAKRTKGGFRLFRAAAVEAVKHVEHLRSLGLELGQIRTLTEARRGADGQQVPCVRSAVEKELRHVKSAIFRYRKLQADMEATLGMLSECASRGCQKTPGGPFCAQCDVVIDRDDLPTTFLAASAQ